MGRRASAACGYLLVAACGQGRAAEPKPAPAPAPTSVTIEQVTTEVHGSGSLDMFVAAVPATEEGGECATIERSEGRGVLYVLSFPRSNAPVRNVSVDFDSAGQPIHYSDLRGDLRREKTGPQTSVLLNFLHGTAQAVNEWPGRPGEMAEGELSAVLEARHLGFPQRTIELIRTRCLKP